jgi:integrase
LGFIFTTPLGTPIDAANDRKQWMALLAVAGVPKVKLHAARHTAASLMFQNDEPIYNVSAVLGHSSITITADVYGHVDTRGIGAAVRALSEALA